MPRLERVLGRSVFGSILFTVALGLSACAPQAKEKLPDDPAVEVVLPPQAQATPAPGVVVPPVVEAPKPAPTERERVLAKYQYLDPTHIVPTSLLESTILFFDANLPKIRNQNYLSVIDFGRSSTQRRFFIINMQSGAVWTIAVAHGKGSDADHDGYAESFSNEPGSNASSLGFYLTAETYSGSNGLSLRLDGLSTANSNARSRAIVLHGASYVKDADVIQGRSWGCPAVDLANRDKVIGLLKEGSLIYAGLSGR